MQRRSWSNRAAATGRAGYGWLNGITALLALPASIVAGLLWQVVGPAAPFVFGALMAGVAVVMLVRLRALPATGLVGKWSKIMANGGRNWREHGVRVVCGAALDSNTPQTPGMQRAAAINYATAGAQKLWAGTVTIQPDAKTGAHHHGALESVIYVVSGRARMRWGDHLEYVAEAGPGDFIFVPPYVPHQEINANTDEPLACVLVRSDQEPVVVNLAIEPVETPETVRWIDPIHPAQ